MTRQDTILRAQSGGSELCDLVWICVLGVPNVCQELVNGIETLAENLAHDPGGY